MFIEYSETVKEYLTYILSNHKVIKSRDVIFMEEATTNIEQQSPAKKIETNQDKQDETNQDHSKETEQ